MVHNDYNDYKRDLVVIMHTIICFIAKILSKNGINNNEIIKHRNTIQLNMYFLTLAMQHK